MLTRRNLIAGLAAFIAAPAVIRVAQLMPVKAYDDGRIFTDEFLAAIANGETWPKVPFRPIFRDGWKLDPATKVTLDFRENVPARNVVIFETSNEITHGFKRV